MGKIAIIYGSSTDNTASAAKKIAGKLSNKDLTLIDVSKLKSAAELAEYSGLILGTSTVGLGDLQDDWDGFLSEFKKADLSGKTVALFGLGDSASYPDTFVDGVGILYEAVKKNGANIVGRVPASGYTFDDSIALDGDEFVGLPLDEDNESDQTDKRISAWVAQIEPLF
jgi:flavodoxin I